MLFYGASTTLAIWSYLCFGHLVISVLKDNKSRIFKLSRVESTVGKGENAGYLACFHNASFPGSFNPLPNDKFLERSKLKVLADHKKNVNEKLKFDFRQVENLVGKGENAGYQHFLLFPQRFQKSSFSGSLKVGIVW